MKKSVYFKNVPTVGDLSIIAILFTFEQIPIEFICINEQGNTFLCHCSEIRKVQKWVISPCSMDVIKQLVNDKISIYDALAIEPSLTRYLAKCDYSQGQTENEYNGIVFSEISSLDLPNDDVFLEAFDENEAIELMARIGEEQQKQLQQNPYASYNKNISSAFSEFSKKLEDFNKLYASCYGNISSAVSEFSRKLEDFNKLYVSCHGNIFSTVSEIDKKFVATTEMTTKILSSFKEKDTFSYSYKDVEKSSVSASSNNTLLERNQSTKAHNVLTAIKAA